MKKLSSLFILFIILTINSQPRFEPLSLQEGVSLNLVYAMMQDSRGFIWFGTMHGLIRYDGREYKTYRNDPDDLSSISFDDIISLFEDSRGNIWIGTWGGGLNKFNPADEEFTRFIHTAGANSISGNIIWAVAEDNSGNIWAGSGSGGINIIENVSEKISQQKIPGVGNSISCLIKDNRNKIWISSEKGLVKYDPETKRGDKIEFSKDRVAVLNIFEDKQKYIWLGTNSGLFKLSSDGKLIEHYKADDKKNSIPGNFIQAIAQDDNDNLWIGTNNGLSELNQEKNIFYNYSADTDEYKSLSGNSIRVLMTDNSGLIWASSYNGGVTKINSGKRNFYSIKNSFRVKAFAEDEEGNIWAGTFGNGVVKYSADNKYLEAFVPPPLNNSNRNKLITSLQFDNNHLWVGSLNGLLKFNLYNSRFEYLKKEGKEFSANVLSLYNEHEKLLIGTAGGGLYIYDKANDKFDHIILNSELPSHEAENFILSITKDAEGNYLLGTYGGLAVMTKEGRFRFYNYNERDCKSLSNDYVFSIFEDSKKNIWIGTGNGLNLLNKELKSFSRFYEKDGLPNSVIRAITEDENECLWITTNKGISKFVYAENKFENYFVEDGLASNLFYEGAIFKASNNSIYAGGNNGISYFNPPEIILNKFNPAIQLTSIEIIEDGINKAVGNAANNFSASQNLFKFKFASLDFHSPLKNKYQYMLEGYDKNWSEASVQNISSYTNLSPGRYTFKVRGTNSDGAWSSNTAEYSFVILPPFYLTWWFIAAIILFIAALLLFLHRANVKRKIKAAIKIEKLRGEESEKIRKKTSADFHDELGHHLTRISLLAEMLKRKSVNADPLFKNYLEKISQNARDLYNGTRDFIWSIDPQKDSAYELMIRLKDFGDDIYNGSDFSFIVTQVDDELKNYKLSMDWRRNLALIFKEGMNNSLKYSSGQKIYLQSKIKNGEFEISLADEGPGFMISQIKEGNGLKNMRKRAESIASSLKVESVPGLGTKIIFRGKPVDSIIHQN